MPYRQTSTDPSQKKQIEELFEEMLSFIESRKKKNTAMKVFLDAVSKSSLDAFREQIY